MASSGHSSNCDSSTGAYYYIGQDEAKGSLEADGATLIALSVSCGVLFVLFAVFAIAMCYWRMKCLKLQRQLDGAADGVVDLELSGQGNAGTRPGAEDEEPMASGAL